MLRLPPFELEQPDTLEEAMSLLARHGTAARLLSGGTDLLVAMKQRRLAPEVLVSLKRVPELGGVTASEDSLTIGAAISLDELAAHPVVGRDIPVLAEAAGRVAGPQIRRMASLGGNLCLDTRCRYINQSEFWREALGGCLKSHGQVCHVVPGGRNCVAALSSDTAPLLVALQATLNIVNAEGGRTCTVRDLYNSDGERHVNLGPGELLCSICVPKPGPETLLAYRKWSVRDSLDFPLVSVAIRLELADTTTLRGGTIVVGALAPKPRVLSLSQWEGARLDTATAEQISQLVYQRCRPLPSLPYDPEYRRERLAVEVRRGIADLIPEEATR